MTMLLEPSELTESERQLQLEVRAYLRKRLPPGSYEPGLGMACPADPDFSRDLGRQGWLGMTLPREYGGGGRTAVERLVVTLEVLAVGAPVLYHWVGDRQSGPNILKNGTEEQRRELLPRIASGEISFAIGMSEPDAGSDLASVRTKATPVDGGWLVNGTKIWTSGAMTATHVLALFRTGPERRELTQFIVPTDVPGLTISPIPFIDGSRQFCELSFVDVTLPDTCRLGEVGGGWSQNTDELALERGGVDRWLSAMTLVERWAARVGADADAAVLADLGGLMARMWGLLGLSLSVARMVDRGHSPVVEAALIKEMATRFEQDCVETVLQHHGAAPDPGATDEFERLLARAALVSPSWTIRGGTNEVLRTVIAKGLGTR